MIMTAQLLLSLSILIVVHEWGHYITARTFNIKVEKFYLFFDFLFPMANVLNFSLLKYKKGDTEFGIGWFPLGGYVKIAGMVDESMDKEQMKLPPQDWEFRAKPAWQRLIVMLGGIIVNVIVGVLIFIGLTYFIGDTYIPNEYVNKNGGVEARELAQSLGLKTGDQILKINGNPVEKFDDVYKADVLLSQDASYTVKRGSDEIVIPIPTDFIENFNSKEAAINFLLPRTLATVSSLRPTSIAERVGLKTGDKFVEVNGMPVQYFDEVASVVKPFKGDSISFKVSRDGTILSFKENFKGEEGIGFYVSNRIAKEDLIIVNYSLGQSIVLGPVVRLK
jgi:Predicted membrane-associated Zn-dependent proteases 1